MNRNTTKKRRIRGALKALVWAAALTTLACESDVNFNTPAPTFPSFPPSNSLRELEITGSLTAFQGLAMEATVLFDGRELAGARTVCPEERGCRELELSATTRSGSGRHSIAFQVLSQSPEAVEYVAEGTVQVKRDGLGFVMLLPLERTRATLELGESVSFDVSFLN